MAVLLGLASALIYGAADFTGGMASKRSPVLAVVVCSQLVGLLLLIGLLPLLEAAGPTWLAIGWGGVSGVAGGVGIVLLYRGLAAGRMSVVAPITAVGAALVPAVFGVVTGERPGAAAFVGILLALTAIVLVSGSHGHRCAMATPGNCENRSASSAIHMSEANEQSSAPEAAAPGVGVTAQATESVGGSGVGLAVAAGLAFGVFFITLERAGPNAGLWPLLGARTFSVGLLGVAAIATRRSLRPAAASYGLVALAGALDMFANALYLLALREGLLSLVAVLTSLYPASTVVLARVVLRERLTRVQLAGLGCAALGVGLIAGG